MENCVGKIEEYDDQINRIKPLNQRQGIWKLIHNQVIYRRPIQERQSIKSFSAAFGTMPAYSTLVGAVWLCGNWSGWTTSAFLMTDTRGFAVHYIHQAQTKGIYLREWWIVQGLYTFGRFYRNYQFKLSSSSSSFPDFFLFFFSLSIQSQSDVSFSIKEPYPSSSLSLAASARGWFEKLEPLRSGPFRLKPVIFFTGWQMPVTSFAQTRQRKKTGEKRRRKKEEERGHIWFLFLLSLLLENDDHITEENQQMDKSITKISIPIGHT